MNRAHTSSSIALVSGKKDCNKVKKEVSFSRHAVAASDTLFKARVMLLIIIHYMVLLCTKKFDPRYFLRELVGLIVDNGLPSGFKAKSFKNEYNSSSSRKTVKLAPLGGSFQQHSSVRTDRK